MFPYRKYQRKMEENDSFGAVTCLNLVENVINSFLRSTGISPIFRKSKIVQFIKFLPKNDFLGEKRDFIVNHQILLKNQNSPTFWN